mgnify:FL=1
MKIYKISVFTNPEGSSYSVKWFESDSDSIHDRTVQSVKFDDLESANIFAFELKKNQYLLNNL